MLYHKEVGFPQVALPIGDFYLQWTDHAIDAAYSDVRGTIPLLECISVKPSEIFEIETDGFGFVRKIAVRLVHSVKHDLILVLLRGNKWNEMTVKTAWLNRKHDNHRTLKKCKYTTPNR